MGDKRIRELIDALESNKRVDLHNSLNIFTTAQAAVDKLRQNLDKKTSTDSYILIPPSNLTKTDLMGKYGSYNKCRKAAKDSGIHFSRTPSWLDLEVAFNYIEALEKVVFFYISSYPDPRLKNITVSFSLKKNPEM